MPSIMLELSQNRNVHESPEVRYPCKPDIFEATYEPVEDPNANT